MRTEEEKVVQAPIVIILGGQEYNVKPLVIRDSRIWRQKVADLLGNIPKHITPDSDKPDEFKVALQSLMSTVPDAIIDLLFDYAVDLDREEIEGIATDAEIGIAFTKILEVAFPLTQSLVKGAA
jgi:hypothetical protein